MASPTMVYLTSKQRKGLFQRARRRKSTLSQEVRRALDFYLDLPADFDEKEFSGMVREANASMDRTIAQLDDAIAFCGQTMRRIKNLERR